MLSKLSVSDKLKSSVIIFDEIHNFRNKDTISYQNALEIASKAKFRVGLSATPINNSLDDFISELSILLNCSWDAASMMIDDLWQSKKMIITNSLVTRFTKENLGLHFAKRDINSIEIEYPPSYVEKIKNLIGKIPSSKNDFFEKVTYYRLASSSSNAFSKSLGLSKKLIDKDPKISKLQQILKQKKESKWIIFCEFSETVLTLIKELSENWEIFSITGETPIFARQEVIDSFRTSENSILVMSSVGSEGLDVQFCSAIINYDLHWNPMKIEQRIGRIDRIGQKKNKITIVNFIVNGSIDQRILQVIERKLALISNSVFDLPPLIHNQNKKKIEMFDEKILTQESKTSEKFFTSVKHWSSLPIEDYSIILKLDQKFCNLNELKKSAKMNNDNFFKKISEFNKWKKNINSHSIYVKKRITLYS
jgi:SNF2 family DNA or RNA helicase